MSDSAPAGLVPPPSLLWRDTVLAAFREDLGSAGDLTTEAVVPAEATAEGRIVVRERGVVAGLGVALEILALYDAGLTGDALVVDGSRVEPGEVLARVEGPARSLLTAERVALNVLGRLSGIATATRTLVDAVEASVGGAGRPRVVCTRKTTPGLRALEKYAVRAGGGHNHRFGLDDAILVKDNHVALAGGVRPALERVRARVGHLVKLEVEVDSLEQLDEALEHGAEAVLLDNMDPETLAEAVRRIGGRIPAEASGGITVDTVGAVARSGVDLISVGWITHSAPALDVGLDLVSEAAQGAPGAVSSS